MEIIKKEKNSEDQETPKSIPFLLTHVFIERYCTAGISGKLVKSFDNFVLLFKCSDN